MNHKRGKPKSARAGCLWCKPHKHQGRANHPRSKRALAILAEPIAALLLLAGCSVRQLPPADGNGTCGTAAENLEKLGGCGRQVDDWAERCVDASRVKAEVGERLPLTCMTNAATCEAFRGCR